MKKLLPVLLIFFFTASIFAQSHKFEWANSTGGKDAGVFAYSSVTDKGGNIYSTGLFAGKADFDPGTAYHYLTAKNIDAYILKLDASGKFMWVQTIPASFLASGTSLAIDTFNNIYVSGNYSGTIMFDIGTSKL